MATHSHESIPASRGRSFIWWYVCGGALILSGIILSAPAGLLWFLKNKQPSTQFLAPGSQEVVVTKPGNYYLWFDYETLYQGRSYEFSENIPGGLEFKLIDTRTKSAVEMTTDFSTKVSSGRNKSTSIGRFRLDHPGKYRITVSGDSPARVFSFSGDTMSVFFQAFARGAIVLAMGAGLGILIGAIGLIRQVRSRLQAA